MKYFFLALILVLAACEPGDAVDVDINVPESIENAANEVQEGVREVGDALGGGEEAGGETGE